MGQIFACGIKRSRTSSVVALSDSARLARDSARKRRMPGTTPDVDTVTASARSCGAGDWVSTAIARRTSSRLSIGSPMPMKTTFLAGWPGGDAARATRNCATISSAFRWRVKPSSLVAQNTQRRVQPA